MDILKIKLKPFLLKSLVVLISATIIFSVCSVGININTLAEEAQNQFWSGNTVSGYTDFEGKGTDKEPYLIKTPEQLAFAVGKNPELGNHIYYKLANDIKINDTSKTNWEASAKSWKRYDHARFGGVLDGDGYTIDGLYISTNTTTGRYGFISYIGGPKNGSYVAEVKNLKFTNASINHTATSTAKNLMGMAVVAGQTSGKVIFEKIYVDETCKVNAPNVQGVAGIAGRGYDNGNNADPTIKNCTVLATITGNTHVGAIVGSYWAADANVTIEKCFAVTDTGLVGAKDKATLSITDTYTTTLGSLDAGATQVTAENMKGENAKTYMPNLDFEKVWQTTQNGYPVLRAPEKTAYWDGTAAESYAGGLGTQESPWEIETAAQLFKMVKENTTVNTDAAFAEMKYFKITKDIVINPVTAEDMVNPTVAAWDAKGYKTWNPGYTGNQNSNGFYGVVDGGGHTISGLYVKEGQYVGLIPVIVDNASITNIKVTNSFVRASSGSASPGIIVGIVYGKKNNYPTFDLTYSSIDNCYVLADATSSWRIGGLVGGACDAKKITISDCSATNLKMYTTNTGTVGRTGAFIGNVGSGSHVVKNCFTDASTHPVSNTTDTQTNYDQLHKYITWTNVYTAAAKPSFDKYNDITYLTADQMKGEAAKTNMSNFDFEKVWQAVDGGYPVVNVKGASAPAPEESPFWDGTKDSNLEGKGTEKEPYLIKTPAELAYVVSTNLEDGLYFKLANDIKINDTSKANWKDTAKNWVWANVRFVGTFDGDGHTIDGLFYSNSANSAEYRVGLFSYVGAYENNACTIKNFKMTNAYIANNTTEKDSSAGVVAGQASQVTTFRNIYIDKTCEVNSPAADAAGGLLGKTDYNINITNCAVLAKVTGETQVGAFVGWMKSGGRPTIIDSFSATDAPVTGNLNTDKNFLGTASANVYAIKKQGTVDAIVTLLTADQMKGQAAMTYMPKLDWNCAFEAVDGDYPKLSIRDSEFWDGTKDSKFAGGKGTRISPYKIATPEQLAYIASTDLEDGLYFKLVNDIKINDTSKANWKDMAKNWVWANVRFIGTLDGDGHTIDGLYFSGEQTRFGLFGYVGAKENNDCTIKNIKFTNAYIYNTIQFDPAKHTEKQKDIAQGVAIVAGQTSAATTFEEIYIDETCYVNAPYAKGVAGIAGRGDCNVDIVNSAVLGTFSGASHVGSFFGTYWAGAQSVESSYSAANVPIMDNTREFAQINTYTLIEDLGKTTVLTADQMKGELAKEFMPGLDYEKYWETVDGKYPILNVKVSEIWDGTKDSNLEGEGTERNPYKIETAEQLAYVVSTDLDDGKYYMLVSDIMLNDVSEDNWTTTAKDWVWENVRFVGNFDGDGHTIYGLSYKGEKSKFGLFSYVGDSVIENVKFAYASVTPTDGKGAAIVAGQTSAATTFKEIYIDDTCVINAPKTEGVGAISGFGAVNVNISNSAVYASISGKSSVGAFVGYYNKGDITITKSVNGTSLKLSGNRTLASSKDNYGLTEEEGVTKLTAAEMKGDAAKTNMSALDFDRIWQTVDGGYPLVNVRPLVLWDGKAAESFAGGTGTYKDPYLIETAAQLYKMVSEYSNANTDKGSVNKPTYFKQIKDIHINDISDRDLRNPTVESFTRKGFAKWYSLEGDSKGFCGEFDGDGYTIYGLYSNGLYGGLIPLLADGGMVHNVNLKNGFVNSPASKGAAGAVVGYVYSYYKLASVNMDYVTVDNFVVNGNGSRVGGLVGGYFDLKITVNNCSVTNSSVKSNYATLVNAASGLVGYGGDNKVYAEISNCFTDSSVNPVTATTDKATYDRFAKNKYTNVYTSAKGSFKLSGITYLANDAKLQGANVSKVLKGFDFKNDWSATDNYPVLKKGAGLWRYDNNLPGQIWSGKPARYYNSGDGSKAAPFEIKTGGQLALLVNDAINGKTAGKYYKITANIYLNDTSKENWEETAKEWYLAGWGQCFTGKLNGGYHIVSGLYLNKNTENHSVNGAQYGGLFGSIGEGAVIEKLGIVDSKMTLTHDTEKRQLGAFVGYIDHYDVEKAGYNNYPLIRECFADTSVYLEGGTVGGFVGTAMRAIRVEDSFFTGTVKSVARGLIGYSKTTGNFGDVVLIKNFYAADSKRAILSNVSYDNLIYENCYASSSQDTNGVTRLFIDRMCGEEALKYMTLDFEKIWCIRAADETPGLKGFQQNLYCNKMSPEDITVSFETNCDLEVKSITGKAYSKLELPTLEREGYTFCGWYAYPELDTPFTYDYFPTFDTILYAKWEINGFIQDFEQYENTVYDYHEGIDYFRPTSAGYSAKYVHSGGKSMHRLEGGADYRDFLVFYKEELEVGKTYKMVFYTTTDQDKAAVDVSLVHLEHPDVYASNKGVKKVDKVKGLTDGEWTETTYTFTAKTKWVAIRTAGNASIYIDDVTFFEKDNASALAGFFGTVGGIITLVGAAVILAGGAVAFIFIRKRK